MNKNKISIIIPIYNIENYIENCIKSVIEQTYSNIEVLLINDGSTDHSFEICQKCAGIDNRIKVINKKNGGLSDARNCGIENASGQYLMFVDGDDFIHSCACEILLRNLINTQADIAIGGFRKVDNITDVGEAIFNQIPVVYSGRESCFNVYNEFGVNFTVAWGKLYKASCFEKIRYPIGKLHEDEYVTYQLLYAADSVVYVASPLYYYIQREGSMMGSIYDEKNLSILEMANQAIQFYCVKGDRELQELAIRRAFGLCKMLYEKYRDVNNSKCKRIVLKEYRKFLFRYGTGLPKSYKRVRIGEYLYGFSPMIAKCFDKLL